LLAKKSKYRFLGEVDSAEDPIHGNQERFFKTANSAITAFICMDI
jgi:hypothetical protein